MKGNPLKQLETVLELHQFDKQLVVKAFNEDVKSALETDVGKTAGETVRRVMRRLGTAELWLQYNFRGQRGKNAFVDLQNLLDLIRILAFEQHGTPTLAVDEALKSFLKNCTRLKKEYQGRGRNVGSPDESYEWERSLEVGDHHFVMDPLDHVHALNPDPYLLEYPQESQEEMKPSSLLENYELTPERDGFGVTNISSDPGCSRPESTGVKTRSRKRHRKSEKADKSSKPNSQLVISENPQYLQEHRKQLRKLMKYRVVAAKEKAKICFLKRVKLERALDIKIEYPFQDTSESSSSSGSEVEGEEIGV